MPSQINPRSGPFPVYSGTSPPTVDVGVFTIVKTGVNLKAAGTTAIFTVPTGRAFVVLASVVLVTAVTSGGAGIQTWGFQESSAGRTMAAAQNSGSGTPVANQTVYSSPALIASNVFSTCAAGSSVGIVVNTSQAGSSAVTGSVFVTGFYVS